MKNHIIKLLTEGKYVVVYDPEGQFRELKEKFNGQIITSESEIINLSEDVRLIVIEPSKEIPLRVSQNANTIHLT